MVCLHTWIPHWPKSEMHYHYQRDKGIEGTSSASNFATESNSPLFSPPLFIPLYHQYNLPIIFQLLPLLFYEYLLEVFLRHNGVGFLKHK